MLTEQLRIPVPYSAAGKPSVSKNELQARTAEPQNMWLRTPPPLLVAFGLEVAACAHALDLLVLHGHPAVQAYQLQAHSVTTSKPFF